jgi:hypothetical protein
VTAPWDPPKIDDDKVGWVASPFVDDRRLQANPLMSDSFGVGVVMQSGVWNSDKEVHATDERDRSVDALYRLRQ